VKLEWWLDFSWRKSCFPQ